MSFPLQIGRGIKPTLRFEDEDALRQWVTREANAWKWLSDAAAAWGPADRSLQVRVMEAQIGPCEALRGLCEDGAAFTPGAIAFAEGELKRAFVDGTVFASTDPGIGDLLASNANNSAYALGMLAQALGVNIESESADAFAGRQAWLNKLSDALASANPERIATLDKQFKDAETKLRNMKTEVVTHAVLKALTDAQRRNGKWMVVLAIMTAMWVGAGGLATVLIHQMTMPAAPASAASGASSQGTATPPASASAKSSEAAASAATASGDERWSWPQLTERFALYVLLMTAFTWGLRWLGRFFQDVWAAGQSASRRLSSLTLILDDRDSLLFERDDKGRERILAEIFDDRPQTAKPKDKDEEGPQLELLGKLLDVLKKARDVAVPEK